MFRFHIRKFVVPHFIAAVVPTALIVALAAPALHALPEVWLGDLANNGFRRVDLDGNYIETLNPGGGTTRFGSFGVVGNQVWLGDEANNGFRRVDYDGNYIDTLNPGGGTTRFRGFLIVGLHVWIGDQAGNGFRRTTLDGDYVDTLNPGGGTTRFGSFAVVNNLVWLGDQAGNGVRRTDLNGNYVDTINPGGGTTRFDGSLIVGSQVWLGDAANNGFRRTDLNGTYIDTLNPGGGTTRFVSPAIVNGRVWWGDQANNGFRRTDLNGNYVDTLNPGGGTTRFSGILLLQAHDCNSNGLSDFDDITHATSPDCNTNFIPDECEIDENSSAPGGPYYCTENCVADCDNNGVPDRCQADCNANQIPDVCDIAGVTSTDCNTNDIPDDCDIAGPVSDDCNTDQIPDECDIAFATSDDCNGNGVADECEAASGDIYWTGADGDSFTSGANWSPSTVPGTAGNAILVNHGGVDNRCIFGGGSQTVCSLLVEATGSGRQALEIQVGATLVTNAGTSVLPGGDIVLTGGELGGAAVANTSDSISGYGEVSASLLNAGDLSGRSFRLLTLSGVTLDNESGGKLLAPFSAELEISSANVIQSGEIEIRTLAGILFHDPLVNSSGGTIRLLGGSLGFLASGGMTNAVGGEITGFGTIDASLSNDGTMAIVADMQIVGDLVNEGTITIQSGLLTVIGTLSGNGAVIGGFGGRDGSRLGLGLHGDFDWSGDSRQLGLAGASVRLVDVDGSLRRFEVLSADRGTAEASPGGPAGMIGELRIGPGAGVVRLVDRHANVPAAPSRRESAGSEVLYVGRLVLDAGVTLDLAGRTVYVGELVQAEGTGRRAAGRVTDSVGGGSLASWSAGRSAAP